MKNFFILGLFGLLLMATTACSENYSNGERVGYITQFSKTGVLLKSYEAHLNVTQTGMNTGSSFDFSVDRDHESPEVVNALVAAAQDGTKVKITYHQVYGWNWLNNRGETDYFVSGVETLKEKGMINQQLQPTPREPATVEDENEGAKL